MPESSFARLSSTGQALLDLLEQPAIAIRITERSERGVGPTLRIRAYHAPLRSDLVEALGPIDVGNGTTTTSSFMSMGSRHELTPLLLQPDQLGLAWLRSTFDSPTWWKRCAALGVVVKPNVNLRSWLTLLGKAQRGFLSRAVHRYFDL
jgi:hypothetical protein